MEPFLLSDVVACACRDVRNAWLSHQRLHREFLASVDPLSDERETFAASAPWNPPLWP